MSSNNNEREKAKTYEDDQRFQNTKTFLDMDIVDVDEKGLAGSRYLKVNEGEEGAEQPAAHTKQDSRQKDSDMEIKVMRYL